MISLFRRSKNRKNQYHFLGSWTCSYCNKEIYRRTIIGNQREHFKPVQKCHVKKEFIKRKGFTNRTEELVTKESLSFLLQIPSQIHGPNQIKRYIKMHEHAQLLLSGSKCSIWAKQERRVLVSSHKDPKYLFQMSPKGLFS